MVRWRNLRGLLSLCVALSALLAVGCSAWQRLTLADDVRLADRRFGQERYGAAAAEYREAYDEYPECARRERLLVQIARSLYRLQLQQVERTRTNLAVQSFHDAESTYLDYLDLYPDGVYLTQAQEGLERIRAIRANRRDALRADLDKVADDVEQLAEAIQAHPYDAGLHVRHGDALWRLERYDAAVAAYRKGLEIDAALEEYDLIKQRLHVDENGDIVPLTPERRRQIAFDREPLEITRVNDYNSRLVEHERAAGEVYYNVQGLVRNRSSRHLDGVVVEVRFYNPGMNQLDVQKDHIGHMPPGAVRAFGVRASNYDDIYNISRYECVAYEQ